MIFEETAIAKSISYKRRKGFANSQIYNLKRVLERSHKAPCDLG
ncbi:hypothetical protein HORM4_620029 [Vibrio harveyi]|nr:hypothetical protein HORM4_620029 [Vibrio harveyi]